MTSASTIDGGLPGIIAIAPGIVVSRIRISEIHAAATASYESILQRLTVDGPKAQGWYTFPNTTVADHRTSYQDYQIALGFRHTGTFSWRPDDEVGFAWARPT